MTFSISTKIQGRSKNLVPKINAFLHFMQKFKMATKNGGKVDSTDNLQVRNFVEITLSRTVCQINVFCILRRNSRWPPKNGGKVTLAKFRQYTLQIPCGSKMLSKSLSHRFQDECTFALYAEIQEGCQKWRESNFCEKVASRLCIYPVG